MLEPLENSSAYLIQSKVYLSAKPPLVRLWCAVLLVGVYGVLKLFFIVLVQLILVDLCAVVPLEHLYFNGSFTAKIV